MRVFALVAAAGSGTRLGFATPKALVKLYGRTVMEHCLDGLADSRAIDEAVVVVSPEMMETTRTLVKLETNRQRWAAMGVQVVRGRGERVDSVLAGLEHLHARGADKGIDSWDLIAVHDAARCLTPPSMIHSVIASARTLVGQKGCCGVVPAIPVADTIKIVDELSPQTSQPEIVVKHTLPRGTLRAVQTPQVFAFGQLWEAHTAYQESLSGTGVGVPDAPTHGSIVTDDASLMEMRGKRIMAVEGDWLAMKITTPMDYRIAQMLLQDQAAADTADGIGEGGRP